MALSLGNGYLGLERLHASCGKSHDSPARLISTVPTRATVITKQRDQEKINSRGAGTVR